MKGRVSLSDVAEKLGCSVSTVSLALRGDQRVNRLTREKVCAEAKAIGYRPNPIIAALASRRFKAAASGIPIAFLTQQGIYGEAENSVYERERSYAAELGYDLQLYHLPDLQKLSDPSRMLYQRGVEGIILSPFFQVSSLGKMDWSLFAVAAMGGESSEGAGSTSFHRATADHALIVRTAWREALKAGYRRAGLLLLEHKTGLADDIHRHSAGLFCLNQTPRRYRIPILRMMIGDGSLHNEQVSKWVNRYRPDVIIGFNDYLQFPLEQAGWSVPDDVAFVALELSPESHGVAGLGEIWLKVALATVELIDHQVRHRLRGIPESPRVVNVGSRWMPGASLPILARAKVKPAPWLSELG